jgi:hypothetical protein
MKRAASKKICFRDLIFLQNTCMSLHTKFAAFAHLAEWHFLRATDNDNDNNNNNNNNNNNKFR